MITEGPKHPTRGTIGHTPGESKYSSCLGFSYSFLKHQEPPCIAPEYSQVSHQDHQWVFSSSSKKDKNVNVVVGVISFSRLIHMECLRFRRLNPLLSCVYLSRWKGVIAILVSGNCA